MFDHLVPSEVPVQSLAQKRPVAGDQGHAAVTADMLGLLVVELATMASRRPASISSSSIFFRFPASSPG